MTEWIEWKEHAPPEDIQGILIKYADGFIDSDRRPLPEKKRKLREGTEPIGWKFMGRRDPNERTIKAIEVNQ